MNLAHYNKAWTALVMAVITLLASYGVLDVTESIDETVVSALLSPIMVWAVPNADKK